MEDVRHLWKLKRDLKFPTDMVIDIGLLVSEHKDVLAFDRYTDDLPPLITENNIIFNGRGEYGNERFTLSSDETFLDFCETAGKQPYDLLVRKCLIIAKGYLGRDFYFWSSDEVVFDEKEKETSLWVKAVDELNEKFNYNLSARWEVVETTSGNKGYGVIIQNMFGHKFNQKEIEAILNE